MIGRILLVMAIAVAPAVVLAFPDGPPWGSANPAANQDCAACHFVNEPVRESEGLAIEGLPEELQTSTTYDLEITFVSPHIVVAGFQLIAQAAGRDVGTLTSVADDIEYVGSSMRSSAPRRGLGQATWRIKWSTPENIPGPVDVFLAASAANDDGSPFGDTAHFKSYRLSAAASPRRSQQLR